MGGHNRISGLFEDRSRKLLSIYFTAGYPELGDTVPVCTALEKHGVDLIEIGFPFSDSLVDGPTIQMSNERALKNGMNMTRLFEQLKGVRDKVSLPLVLMSCVNPLLCYGLERFCEDASAVGIDGVIIPDWPPEYLAPYRALFDSKGLSTIFLITPHTTDQRVRMIDEACSGFVYAVSSDAITGNVLEVDDKREEYLKRIARLGLKNPFLVGFGISDRQSYQRVCEYARGAIVGSAFIRALSRGGDLEAKVGEFVRGIR